MINSTLLLNMGFKHKAMTNSPGTVWMLCYCANLASLCSSVVAVTHKQGRVAMKDAALQGHLGGSSA